MHTHIYTCYLSEFPGDADGPTEAVTADQQSLHGPACEVAKCKDVAVAQNVLPCYHCAVYGILLWGQSDRHK